MVKKVKPIVPKFLSKKPVPQHSLVDVNYNHLGNATLRSHLVHLLKFLKTRLKSFTISLVPTKAL